jgi:hypothetical protein
LPYPQPLRVSPYRPTPRALPERPYAVRLHHAGDSMINNCAAIMHRTRPKRFTVIKGDDHREAFRAVNS